MPGKRRKAWFRTSGFEVIERQQWFEYTIHFSGGCQYPPTRAYSKCSECNGEFKNTPQTRDNICPPPSPRARRTS